MRAMLTREALNDLRGKYVEMLDMRLSHAAGSEDPHAVRTRMAWLAARFPGALREIDEMPLGEINRRVTRLAAVLAEAAEAEAWMGALAVFHRLARGALSAKRWLAGRKQVDATVRQAYADALPSLHFSADASAWAPSLEQVARPPRGRLTDLVLTRTANEIGLGQSETRLLVFGAKGETARTPVPPRGES